MELKDLYDEGLFVASRLMEANKQEDALTVLMLLAENEAFGDVRLIACTNCAIVCGNLGRIQDAFAWYERGIAIEEKHPTRLAARRKAALLAEVGRTEESLALFLELLSLPLPAEELERIRAQMVVLDDKDPAA
jgi:tetratricopeptide (TPR) repeat protein